MIKFFCPEQVGHDEHIKRVGLWLILACVFDVYGITSNDANENGRQMLK